MDGARKLGTAAASALLSMSLVLGGMPAGAAWAGDEAGVPPAGPKVIRLPASNNPEIFAAQRTMVEAWQIVGEAFVDPEFNAHDWPEELREHMVAAYGSAEPRQAWDEINSMLSSLGDPYTRRIDSEEYHAFRVSTDGELQGIGLLIANELTPSGHLRVLAPIRGGPAERAGVQPGDELLAVDGQDTTGWSGDQVAHALRGQGGTQVRIKLAAPTSSGSSTPPREVVLRREAVVISPVFSTLLRTPDGPSPPIGYVRLSQFSTNAATDMRKALAELKAGGAGRYILDLRSNPGGLVKAGVDVAALWLDGEQVVFTVASRDTGLAVQTTETAAPALTHDPLVVLVDGMSASASEIVSGALHDNHRATVMGDVEHTFGKGRIQSVYELQDGSALFVTVAKYRTPGGADIDRRGIHPDRSCRVPLAGGGLASSVGSPRLLSVVGPAPDGASPVSATPGARPLMTGLPMQAPAGGAAAAEFMPGVPLDRPTETLLLQALVQDRCVLAATQYLEAQREAAVPALPPLTPAQTLYLALIDGNRATL